MYETPQYLTPGGFRRSAKNPYRKKLEEIKEQSGRKTGPHREGLLLPALPLPARKKPAQFELSDKAAAIIAQALKGMLKK